MVFPHSGLKGILIDFSFAITSLVPSSMLKDRNSREQMQFITPKFANNMRKVRFLIFFLPIHLRSLYNNFSLFKNRAGFYRPTESAHVALVHPPARFRSTQPFPRQFSYALDPEQKAGAPRRNRNCRL